MRLEGLEEHMFGSSPVSDEYFKFLSPGECDLLVRDVILSSSTVFKEIPAEDDDAIWIDLSGEVPVMSKGFKDFFFEKIDL